MRKIKLTPLALNLDQIENKNNNFYSDSYTEISESGRENSYSSIKLHKSLEKGIFRENFNNVLELGGNRGEHIPYVKHSYLKYVCTDLNAHRPKIVKSFDGRVFFEKQNAENLSYSDESFDRIIMTCLLHHVTSPESVLLESKRVIRNDGLISIFLPHDPGILYRLLRSLTTLRRAKKMNRLEEIQLIHAREHKNHFLSLEFLIRQVYQEHEIYKFSFPDVKLGYNLNAFSVYHIKISNKEIRR
jgi:ubiquinone/menaquinone biosynthesis C-methylase UbiE